MKTFLVRGSLIVAAIATVLFVAPTNRVQAALPLPKMDNGMDGFGGFITNVTPCICADIGALITVSGPFGGDYLYSFTHPPKVKIGSFFMIGGPVLGAVKGSGSCGTRIDRGCKDKKSGKTITYLGGLLQ
jgi:hypothetical protein